MSTPTCRHPLILFTPPCFQPSHGFSKFQCHSTSRVPGRSTLQCKPPRLLRTTLWEVNLSCLRTLYMRFEGCQKHAFAKRALKNLCLRCLAWLVGSYLPESSVAGAVSLQSCCHSCLLVSMLCLSTPFEITYDTIADNLFKNSL